MFKGFICGSEDFLCTVHDFVREVDFGILPFSLQGDPGPPGPPGSAVSTPTYDITPTWGSDVRFRLGSVPKI